MNWGQKKAHLMEIQVNGGADAAAKVNFATSMFEKAVPVESFVQVGVFRVCEPSTHCKSSVAGEH